MTPRGSFHGSKREIWEMSGRSGSTPNRWTVSRTTDGSIGAFFKLNGSIAGAINAISGMGMSGLTYSCIVKIAASYRARYGLRNSQISQFACVRSMWHRQIQVEL